MTPESYELANVWLAKAQSDLDTARILINGSEQHLDTGCFHCQQTAEKALKAWLTACEVIFPKTHSLEALLAICIRLSPEFRSFQRHAEELSPLATEFRYPGDVFEPTMPLALNALASCEEIYAFCEQAMKVLAP